MYTNNFEIESRNTLAKLNIVASAFHTLAIHTNISVAHVHVCADKSISKIISQYTLINTGRFKALVQY
jgi:hypothetical protein